jgi:hypothetical protein
MLSIKTHDKHTYTHIVNPDIPLCFIKMQNLNMLTKLPIMFYQDVETEHAD